MKNILIFGLILLSYSSIYGQKIDWKQIDSKQEDFNLTSTYFLSDDNSFCALFEKPAAFISPKTFENYVLRTFNSDFSKYTQVNIPPETPDRFFLKPFKNYTIISGCDAEPYKHNPRVDCYSHGRVIFADKMMNPLTTTEFKQYNEKNILEGAPILYFNYDSTFVICANIEKPLDVYNTPLSKDFNVGSRLFGMTVINSNLEKVWSGLVDFKTILGKDVLVIKVKFNYINDHFYAIASVNGNQLKKTTSAIYIIEFDKDGNSKVLHKEDFKTQPLIWDLNIDKTQVMTIGGYYKTSCKNLFSFQYSFKSKELTIPVKTVVIDKAYTTGNEEMQEMFKPEFRFPFNIIPMQDGYIWYREDGYSGDQGLRIEDINLLKFDGDLNLKWVKRIHKNFGAPNGEDNYSSYFVRDNKLVIFYYDYEEYYNSDKRPNVVGMTAVNGRCLVKATVASDGVITKEIVFKVNDYQIIGNTYNMVSVNKNKYFLIGRPFTRLDNGELYVGTIDFNDK